ncbi:DDE-domain-containing protein, partial [Calocera viscosa TUFC12733]
NGLAVSGELLRAQWRWFATEEDIEQTDWLKLSDGWLTRFKQRHGLKGYKLHGEAASMPPNHTLATKQMAGRKTEKHRLSYAFTVNADGTEKLPPLIIGRWRCPHCFLNKDGTEYGFRYFWNLKSWMTGEIFKHYIEGLDRTMRKKRHHILLLLDNFSRHKCDTEQLTNIRLEFFPPNMTSHVQPLDQGIIQCFKMRYRRLFCEHAVLQLATGVAAHDLYHVDQLQIMNLAKEA